MQQESEVQETRHGEDQPEALQPGEWYSERHQDAGSAFSLRITERLARVQTEFQTIEIFQTTDWGKLMVIDDCVMLTSRDNFLYHEMLTHPALFTHQNPRRVVIIGGGDCGTLREVLRHEGVEKASQVEIDEQVTRLAEVHFPELCEANNDPRAELLFIDGIRYMQQAKDASIDLIIVDSTDPIGPAEGLFGPAFVADCYRALGDGGIMVQQSESPLLHPHIIKPLRQKMRSAGFSDIRTLPFPQPVYPSGWWSCTLARKGGSLDSFRRQAAERRRFETRYYNAAIHEAALAEPEFMKQQQD